MKNIKENKVVVKNGKPAWKLAYNALESVFTDEAKGKRILIKPSIGRLGPEKSATCTHPEVVRGIIRFFQDNASAKIFVGDGAIAGISEWEALASSGILSVSREEGAEPVDLDQYSPLTREVPAGVIVDSLNFTSFIDHVDLIVSVPVMKTHMYTTVTLSIKNMKGCLYKKEKTRLHRSIIEPPDKNRGLTLDYGIADMSAALLPDYAVIDGIVGMEGFGPSIGTPVSLDTVVASQNPVAADMAAVELMGMSHDAIPHINLTCEKVDGVEYAELKIEPEDYLKYGRTFSLPTTEKFKDFFPNVSIVEKGSCSACSASIMSFLKAHSHKLPEDFIYTLAAGKDLEVTNLTKGCVFLIGNCAKRYKDEYGVDFCPGCPPVGSRIFETIEKRSKPIQE